jgi:hypothetical protein
MRTSIEISDELCRQLKRKAADEGVTIRQVMERALRAAKKSQNISRKGAKAAKFGQVRRIFLCVLGVLARSIFQLCAEQ